MNRPIKFRAWDTKNKKWLKDEDFLVSPQYGGVFEWFFDGGTSRTALSDIEIMQFTGLLDKNGKEIYEGDILTGNYVVRYEGGCFVVQLSKSETGAVAWLLYRRELEVIGNIYENPELIQK